MGMGIKGDIDINADGAVNVLDVQEIVNIILGALARSDKSLYFFIH